METFTGKVKEEKLVYILYFFNNCFFHGGEEGLAFVVLTSPVVFYKSLQIINDP